VSKRYHYVGAGLGVPGLPHEISDEEAKSAGLEQLLADALKAGTYEEVKPKTRAAGKAEEGD